MNEIFLSGIQPSSSSLQLGNYIGAILNWKTTIKNSQSQTNNNDKFFWMIADLHTMTSLHNPEQMKKNIKNLLATYIACGIEPNENIHFFLQSSVPAHCELNWILTTICPLGQLQRMTQFKDKKEKLTADEINTGLLCYPVLMAGDILLYQTTTVPVGEDQKQHLEFCRDIVDRFNNVYSVDDVFTMPNALIDNTTKRIMSLGDGTKKMSKSTGTDNDKIFLTDENDAIAKKIKVAKTDSIMGIFSDENRPEVSNLINIFSALSGKQVKEIDDEYRDKNTKKFKDDLTEVVVNAVAPIREKTNELIKNTDELNKILKLGNETANEVANKTLKKVKSVVGIVDKIEA